MQDVPDLTPLHALRFLDLSGNGVEDFDPELLPFHLRELRMAGNACCAHVAYRQHVLAVLPWLSKLDGVEVTRDLRLAYDLPLSDDDDEEADEEGGGSRPAADQDAGLLVEENEEQVQGQAKEAVEEAVEHRSAEALS